MKKKVLSGLLALCLVFGSASALPQGAFDTAPTITASAVSTATSGKCGENVKWKLTDGKLTISGTGEMTDYSDNNSPFCDRTDIQTVVIGSGVTSIGNLAFCYCTKLVDITIPDSVTRIGYNAFEGCENLTSVTLPNSIDSIYLQTFMCCYSLESVTLPDSITGIYTGAFYGCKKLKNINIPDSVEHIDTYAFKYCPNLTSLTIPSSVESIGTDAIDKECTIICEKGSKAEKYAKDNGLDCNYSDGDYLYKELDDGTVEITKYSGNYTILNIPSTLGGKQVTSIGSDAFSDRMYLEKIIIPSGVTNIAEKAFASAPGLKKIIIPDSVKSIGDNAFNSKCTIICTKSSFAYVYASLYSIKCEYIAGDYIYKDIDDETVEITGYTGKDKTVNIPSKLAGKTVTSIGNSAFEDYISLTNVTIPSSVKSIGDGAFSNCRSLTNVTIPNSVTSIGEFAFCGCGKLESAVIPTGVETITHDLFAECRGLKSVTIPSSVKSIGDGAFSNCSSLTSITIPGNVTYIGASSFEGCTGLKSLTIPSSVETIDDYAFIGCGFTSLTVPKTVTKIGKEAIGYFYNELYSLVKDDNFTVKCYKGSKADTYAQNNKLKIKYVDVKHVAAKAPTCTAKGNIEYWKHDGKFYSDANLNTEITQAKTVVKATGHNYGKPSWTWSGTTKATAKFTCANDNSHVETVTADITSKTTKATCEKDGKTVYTATVTFNGQTYTKTKTVTIDKLGHKYGEPTWTWTGTKAATAKFVCANDKSHVETVTAKITSKTTKATCTADGKTVYTATVTFGGKTYTDTKTVTITKTGHKWGTPTWTWDGVKSATAKFTCVNDNSHVETVTADITSKTTKATCEKDGKTVYTATVTFNGQTYTKTKTVTIDKLGHKYGEPTWTWDGVKSATAKFTCANDKSHVETVTAKITSKTTKATCTADGKTVYTATVTFGGKTYTDTKTVTITKTGHKWGTPTWTWDGVKSATAKFTCANDKSHTKTVTAKISSTTTKATCEKDGKTVYTATVTFNGQTYTDTKTVTITKTGHKFSDWKTTKAPTTKTEGEETRTCSVCKKTEKRAISKLVIDTQRVAGDNRYATAAEIAKAAYPSGAKTVVLASGLNYADALVGVPLASNLNAPILLATDKSLPRETTNALEKLGTKNVIILGGYGAIGEQVEKTLNNQGITTERYEGKSRFGTAAAIAEKLSKKPTSVFFVYYNDFPDALSASTVAAIKNAPIIYLTTKGDIHPDTAAYLAKLKKAGSVKNAYIIGGTGVIDDDMKNKVGTALGVTPKRLAGANRYETCVEVNKYFKNSLSGTSLCLATGADYPDALAGGVFAAIQKAPLFLVNGKVKNLTLSDKQKAYLKTRTTKKIFTLGGKSVVPDSHVRTIVDEY